MIVPKEGITNMASRDQNDTEVTTGGGCTSVERAASSSSVTGSTTRLSPALRAFLFFGAFPIIQFCFVMRWRAGLRVHPQSRSSAHSLASFPLCLSPPLLPHIHAMRPSPLPPKHPIPAVSSSFVSLSPSPNCLSACPPSPQADDTLKHLESSGFTPKQASRPAAGGRGT
jgi:hypothetical protein